MDNFSQATSKLAQSQSLYPRLSFITFGDVEDSRNRISRKAVRSHAALYQHAASRESKGLNESAAKKKQIRRYKKQDVVLDIEILTTIPSEETSGFPEESPRNSLKGTSLQVILGQGRCDPFRTYPIDWNPRIPQLVDHCKYDPRVLRYKSSLDTSPQFGKNLLTYPTLEDPIP